jgi:hypothetical protein
LLLKPSVTSGELAVSVPHEHTARVKVDCARIPVQLPPPSTLVDGSPLPLQFGPASPASTTALST